MKTVTEWFREQQGWKTESCYCIGGHVCHYTLDGSDFLGEKECDSCGGKGYYYITPKGRHVEYPGGPFC